MTEKRFKSVRIDDEVSYIVIDGIQCYIDTGDDLIVENKLNKLSKENEQLKQFKNEVFNLINAKIKLYSHKPVSAPISQPMSVNFDADMDRLARLSELKALKEELQE